METKQAAKPKVVHPIVQIAQGLVDDVRRRGEVAELLYGTEKTRFARTILEQADEIELLREEKAKLVEALRLTLARGPRQFRFTKADVEALLREIGEK